jgi:hypothetical protein
MVLHLLNFSILSMGVLLLSKDKISVSRIHRNREGRGNRKKQVRYVFKGCARFKSCIVCRAVIAEVNFLNTIC